MTEEELSEVLNGEDVLRTIDVKTLVLDIMRNEPIENHLKIFNERLPNLDLDYVKRFIYMRRAM
jgi:hypothetical protein